MKLSQFTTLVFLGCLLQSVVSLAQHKHRAAAEKKKVDLIIEVNNDLLRSEIPDLHVELNNGAGLKFEAQYLPGHLILSNDDYAALEAAKDFELCFDNYTRKSGKLYITKFKVKLNHSLLTEPYLVLACYDFVNKDYKRLYQTPANKDYAVDVVYPGSTVLARNK